MNTNLNRSSQNQGRELSRLPGAPVPIRHAPSPAESRITHHAGQSGSDRITLENTAGFWELAFNGTRAVVKQHPGLFFVASLMENAPAQPLDASALASGVYANFCDHPDFFILLGWLCRQQSKTDMAQILVKKERTLEAIIDRAPIVEGAAELDPAKAEALAELELLYEFQASYFRELTPATEDTTARRVMADLLSLHASLTVAVDAQGNPHPIARAFALHVLVYMVMPSLRATSRTGQTRFVYEQPQPAPFRVFSVFRG